MLKTNKTKLLTLILAAFMLFMLAACSASSSSTTTTSVSTSKTDADGNTTTTTTTTQVGTSVGTDGVKTTNETATETTTEPAEADGDAAAEEASWQDLADRMYNLYNIGAEGENEAGDLFFYAYNEENDDSAALVIVSDNGTSYYGREGRIEVADDHVVMYDEKAETEIPYVFSDMDEDGTFTMTFLNDGDVATMHLVDDETIVNDIISVLKHFQ